MNNIHEQACLLTLYSPFNTVVHSLFTSLYPGPGPSLDDFQLDSNTRSQRVERQIHQLPVSVPLCSCTLLWAGRDLHSHVSWGDPSPECHFSLSSGILSLGLSPLGLDLETTFDITISWMSSCPFQSSDLCSCLSIPIS